MRRGGLHICQPKASKMWTSSKTKRLKRKRKQPTTQCPLRSFCNNCNQLFCSDTVPKGDISQMNFQTEQWCNLLFWHILYNTFMLKKPIDRFNHKNADVSKKLRMWKFDFKRWSHFLRYRWKSGANNWLNTERAIPIKRNAQSV